MNNPIYAILAGCGASGGSTLGKLSGLDVFENNFLMRILCFLLMIISNTVGCTFFIKALHQTNSSLPATVVSSATNYFLSALSGYLLFGEINSLLCWIGMTFILFGIILITKEEQYVKISSKAL